MFQLLGGAISILSDYFSVKAYSLTKKNISSCSLSIVVFLLSIACSDSFAIYDHAECKRFHDAVFAFTPQFWKQLQESTDDEVCTVFSYTPQLGKQL